MKKRLITSALPYVNNIPHLGNLIQVLSADVFARFCRSRGYDTLYVCGTDEYGTATETKALEEGKTPRMLCDYYHAIHAEIYRWFNISFDHFGRTSTRQQTEIVQSLFNNLDKRGYITEKTTEQLFCPRCERFLADRYVRGTCPSCGYDGARGDQCESCGKLLDPTDLREPKCSTCGTEPRFKSTAHLYIDLPAIQKEYQGWMNRRSEEGRWAKNALQMTAAWIRDGLHERAITRDLKWGIPVPKPGYEKKVFYVWFDAPIGYMSITKELADNLTAAGKPSFDWKADWWANPENVDLFQFIGKDNIPFHTVIFPSTLIGSGGNWTTLYHMSSSEYLNYEGGKFSKSAGVGVFGSDARESGISADVWRFYVFFNRPEKADYQFTWKDFQEKYNGELLGNLGNLINRTLTFVTRYYDGIVPAADREAPLWKEVAAEEERITELLEWAELKDAFHGIFRISDMANKAFQESAPWKTRVSAPEKAAALIGNLCYVIKDLAIMLHPYLPDYSDRVAGFLGFSTGDKNGKTWGDLGKTAGLGKVVRTEIVFRPLDDETINGYRARYSGTQKERSEAARAADAAETGAKTGEAALFDAKIALKAAKIIKVEKHPEADKLYIETLDDGSGDDRVILSGLVPYLKAEELLGKTIVLACNLAPRKMRGIMSYGMLLAADYKDDDGKDCVEVLDLGDTPPGTPVTIEGGRADNSAKPPEIDADTFFSVTLLVKDRVVTVGGKPLRAGGKPLTTVRAVNGEVH